MHEAAGDAVDEQRVRDVEVEDAVDAGAPRGEHRVELLRLRHVPREAVEDEACTRGATRWRVGWRCVF